jgi:ubiquitin-like 1-activating enzyme E1 B
MKDMEAISNENSAEPTIIFDKDDQDTLDFVAASANIRSIIFGIETKSRFDIKQMAGNIIPAIATTNAIVAGLCVLQSFKVLRGDYSSTKEVFLSPFASERLMAYEKTRAPNPDCPVCSVAQTRLLVDLSRATLNDLVEDFLRIQLGYGEEFVVSNEVGLLYDVDETENLGKKLSELGIKGDSFLTVIDEAEEDPRVNLVLSVQETTTPTDTKPISAIVTAVDSEQPISIPRRPRVIATPTGVANSKGEHNELVTNGTVGGEGPELKPGIKRRADGLEENGPEAKRGKLKEASGQNSDDIIVLDSADDGAILIDDD